MSTRLFSGPTVEGEGGGGGGGLEIGHFSPAIQFLAFWEENRKEDLIYNKHKSIKAQLKYLSSTTVINLFSKGNCLISRKGKLFHSTVSS